jgi:predicted transcriptional regulator of viral defense system
MDSSVLTVSTASDSGLRKDQLYALVESEQLERVGRGVYVDPGRVDPVWVSLAAATAIKAEATLCLTSALVYHGLSDAIGWSTDIALPRGTRYPAGFDHVTWHSFGRGKFHVGRTAIVQDGLQLAVYSAERTIIDCFRLGYREGRDQSLTALRGWLKRRGSQPSTLLALASQFPETKTRIREALEVLL